MLKTDLSNFKAWIARGHPPGTERVYFTTDAFTTERPEKLFAYVRQLSADHKVILFQRPKPTAHGRQWEYVARICTDKAAEWVDVMSKATPAPYNRWAHGDPVETKVFGRVYGSTPSGGGGRKGRDAGGPVSMTAG